MQKVIWKHRVHHAYEHMHADLNHDSTLSLLVVWTSYEMLIFFTVRSSE